MGLLNSLGKPSAPAVIPTPTPPSITNPNQTQSAPSLSSPNNIPTPGLVNPLGVGTPNLTNPGNIPAPQTPSTSALTDQQQQLNLQMMQALYGTTAANQVNPYGSLTYTQDPNTGQYTASQQYNPTTQNILDQLQRGQAGAGTAAANLYGSNNFANGAPDLGSMASGATKAQLDAYTNYNQPYYNRAYQNLDNQLRNQGLVPGMESYDYQIKQLRDQQGLQQSNAAAQFEPQAFSQANTQANLPADLAAKYTQNASPGSIQNNLWNTPQAQGQSANISSLLSPILGAQAGMYGSQLGANTGLNSTLASMFGTEVGGANALNSTLSNLYGTQQGANSSLNSTLAGIFGSQLGADTGYNQALMSGYGTQTGGIGQQNQANMNLYNSQLSNWGNMLKGIGGIAAAPFTGGLSLGALGSSTQPGTTANGGWSTTTTPTNFMSSMFG